MNLLEIDRSATVAWSPLAQNSNLMAVGTVAGTLDIDFDTSATLEILSLDFANRTTNVVGKASVSDRFNKICWGLTGTQSGAFPKGIIAGGLANGTINLWDPAKMMSGDEKSLIASCEKHASGPVMGLDFNPFQHNLLASGANDSEIYIWDLQNPTSPTVYNPGAKGPHQHADNPITVVAWNRKVQHVLASTTQNGITSIWDLRAKRSVLTFSNASKKLRCRSMVWNPEEGTQLIVASEDDTVPDIEIWDLKNSHAPTKTLKGHTAGVWGVSWSPMDNDLLLSCGKDNKTLCWNIKSSEILCEIDASSQRWNFDVQWAPKVPAVFSTCSLEGKIKVYSLQDARVEQSSDKGASQTAATAKNSTPPKWLKRPVGATFGFGGKLFSFKKQKVATDAKTVTVSQVITESELLARADKLEQALANDDIKAFCEEKIATSNAHEKAIWGLLKVLLEEGQRTQILYYLGFDKEEIAKQIEEFAGKTKLKPQEDTLKKSEEESAPKKDTKDSADEGWAITNFMSNEGPSDSAAESESPKAEAVEEEKPTPKPVTPLHFDFKADEGMITNALLVGDIEGAIDCCIQAGNFSDALILAAYKPALWKKTQELYFQKETKSFQRVIRSIVNNELRELVEQTDLSQWKAALAILCTYAKKEDLAVLCGLLGDRLKSESKDNKSATLCYVCSGNIDKAVAIWAPADEDSRSDHSRFQNLLNFIEKVSVFRKAINYKEPLDAILAQKYSEFAFELASQGRTASAVKCISFIQDSKMDENNQVAYALLDRLYNSQRGLASTLTSLPPFPYKRQEVGPITTSSPAVSQHATTAQRPTHGQNTSAAPSNQAGAPPMKYAPYNPQNHPQNPFNPLTNPPARVAEQRHMAAPPHSAMPSYGNNPMPPSLPSAQHGHTHAPPTGNVSSLPHPTHTTASSVVATDKHAPLVPRTTTPIQKQTPTSPVTAHAPLHSGPSPLAPPPLSSLGAIPVRTTAPVAMTPPPSIGGLTPMGFGQNNAPFTPVNPVMPPLMNAPPPMNVPPPAHSHTHPPPPMGGPTPMVPAPTANPMMPPPSSVGPPPASTTPAVEKPAPAPAKAEPGPTTSENQFIIESLGSILSTCSKSSDPKVTKLYPDVSKRSTQLIEKLTKNDVSPALGQSLSQLCQAITSGDSKSASGIKVEIIQQHYEELGSSLTIFIRRLTEITFPSG